MSSCHSSLIPSLLWESLGTRLLRSLLFSYLGVTREVLGYVDPWFNCDHHPGGKPRVSVNDHRVVGVHTKVVTQVMWVQFVH